MTSTPQPPLPPPGSTPFIKTRDSAPAYWSNDILWLFVVIPRNTIHGFRVDSEAARVLNSYIPASWETAVVALAEPAENRTIPPRDHASLCQDRVTALMKAFGMTPVPGPDPLRPSNSNVPER